MKKFIIFWVGIIAGPVRLRLKIRLIMIRFFRGLDKLKIKTLEITYQIYVCPNCSMFLSKDVNKIPDSCLRCKTKLQKWDDPKPIMSQWKL